MVIVITGCAGEPSTLMDDVYLPVMLADSGKPSEALFIVCGEPDAHAALATSTTGRASAIASLTLFRASAGWLGILLANAVANIPFGKPIRVTRQENAP
jgi:hypothetical protein